MKTQFKVAAIAAVACLQATAAHAEDQEPKGFYGALDVGVASVSNVGITYYDVGGTFGGTGAQDTFQGVFDAKSAATFGGTLGYDFGMVRTDLEISYAHSKIKSFKITKVNGAAVTLTDADRADACDYLEVDVCGGSGNTFVIKGSHLRQLNGMGNLWLDIPVGGTFVPYVGGGLGVAGFEVDGEGKARFAWQLGAGAAVHVSRAFALTADYRHREASKLKVAYDASSGFRLNKIKTDSFTVGVRAYF
jgi:opacity protein-like surface antigen